MINWSTNEKTFKKKHPGEYKLWRLTQLINYGLDGERLKIKELKKYWLEIKDGLDPDKQKTIEWFLWNKKWHRETGLLPDRSNFWQWYFKNHTS